MRSKPVAKGLDAFGHIDLVVANAGVFRPTRFLEITEEEYEVGGVLIDSGLCG